MPTIPPLAAVFSLLLATTLPATSPPLLQVDIVLGGRPLPRSLEATAVREARLIWAPYGVDLRVVHPGDPARDSAVTVGVVLADRPPMPLPKEALGSIDFQDDVPKSEILMYPDAIAALVADATLMERGAREWPPMLRDLALGRALGRALAHEIGHFLLRSRGHSSIGLMRAHLSVVDLIGAERARFFLSSGEVARLVSMRSVPSE
jgi:hypothetical protein